MNANPNADKFLDCLICGKPVAMLDPNDVKRDSNGHIQEPYNIIGGHIRIDFGYGSRFDIVNDEWYQAHICDECFEKVEERTRRVRPTNPVREVEVVEIPD